MKHLDLSYCFEKQANYFVSYHIAERNYKNRSILRWGIEELLEVRTDWISRYKMICFGKLVKYGIVVVAKVVKIHSIVNRMIYLNLELLHYVMVVKTN